MSARNAKVGPEVLETLSEVKDGSNSKSRDNIRNFERNSLKSETQRAPSWIQNLKHYFSEYCLTSGVHGVRYMGEHGRFLVEKLTWSVVIVTMCYCCVTLILTAYNKWITSPVIVTFAATETPIWKIPFPAVTICPVVKSDPQIFNYTDVLKKIIHNRTVTEKEFRYYESFWLVCDGTDVNTKGVYMMLSKKWPTMKESPIYDLYTAFAKTDYLASWLGSSYDDILILATYTKDGICYSFNMLDINEIIFDTVDYAENRLKKGKKSEKWSSESGYSDGDVTDVFPRRTFLPGINGGFQVQIMTNNSHLDYICGDMGGFKVALHHPSELPDMNQHFLVPLDQAISVAIKPRMITVSEEVRSYKPNKRGCFFANERPLTFFRRYSQRNCLDECLANYTLMKCGCVASYMPKFHKTSTCERRHGVCLSKSNEEYLFKSTVRNDTRERNLVDCNCLPSCISLAYDAEISQCEWNWRKVFHVLNGTGFQTSKLFNLEKDHYSRVSVYFGEMQFLSSERHEHYGSVEFFSNSGGLLGLFIGFSVTSVVEIIYFLTLRVVCNIKKYGQAIWPGDNHLKN